MTAHQALAQIRIMRLQLKALESTVKEEQQKPKRSFADLYGVFKGQFNLTTDDLDKLKYRFNDDWVDR